MDALVPSYDPPRQWRTPEQKAELRGDAWFALRERIKARDNNTCRWCGHQNRYWMSVDHIDGNSTNNDDGNLQTLCFWCHMVKHAGLWTTIYPVMDLYENPGGVTQVDVIRQTRALRGEGLADAAILARIGLVQRAEFRMDYAYLATKLAFITTRSYVRDDGRTMIPGHVGVRIRGRYLQAILDPPASPPPSIETPIGDVGSGGERPRVTRQRSLSD